MSSFNGSLVIDVRSKTRQRFRVASMLLFYTLQEWSYWKFIFKYLLPHKISGDYIKLR